MPHLNHNSIISFLVHEPSCAFNFFIYLLAYFNREGYLKHVRCSVFVLLEASPISTQDLWSSARLTIMFLVTSFNKALLPRLLSLARRPALGRVLVVQNVFHLGIIKAIVLLGTFNAADIFLYPSPDLCLDTILSLSSAGCSFDVMAWFLLWYALSVANHYIDRCAPFQIMSNKCNLPQDSNQGVETSQRWSR